MNATRALLPGARWHFAHGPIDLVIGAEGEDAALRSAHEAAWQRFAGVLAELVAELPLLRKPVGDGPNPCAGPVARRMWAACRPHRPAFVTPMAAVAGAVAEEIVAAYDRPGIRRAWVNNGGDIALRLAAGAEVSVGLCADAARRPAAGGLALDARLRVGSALPVRGIATSGWGGRSFSLGIADSVTVLAATAAEADAAATMIANAVDVPDARILRRPANRLKDDSDLGEIPVTVAVPALEDEALDAALAAGLARARALQAAGCVWAVALVCQQRSAWLPPAGAPSRCRSRSPAEAGAAPQRDVADSGPGFGAAFGSLLA